MAELGTADSSEPETLPKAVPASDENYDNATIAPGQPDEGKDMSDAVQSENGVASKASSSEKIGDNEEKKNENDSGTRRGDPRNKDKNFYSKRSTNIKFDPSVNGVSSDAQGIRNLVAFYFSDTNLGTDDHLMKQIDGAKNNPVKIKHIHTFKRLRQYQPYSAVVAALRESEFFEVSGFEGLEEIRRKIAYNPNPNDKSELRSVYAKGFGEETATTQFEAEDFFAPYSPSAVRLRRNEHDGTFKGSCFAEFEDEETCQKFLDLDPKPLWKGKHELVFLKKSVYMEEKNKMIREGKIDPNASRPFRGRGRGGKGNYARGDRGNRDHGDRDPDDWKKRREDDQRSGFRDNRNRRDNRDRNGSGRGRSSDRYGRNNDRNQERRDKDQSDSKAKNDVKVEKDIDVEAENKVTYDIKVEKDDQDANTEPEKSTKSKKREREDDTEAESRPIKKVNSREEVSTTS